MTEQGEIEKLRELIAKQQLQIKNREGATAKDILYTFVESACANDLDVYEYLNYTLTIMLNIVFCNPPEAIDDLLTWSDQLSDRCCLLKYRKECQPR